MYSQEYLIEGTIRSQGSGEAIPYAVAKIKGKPIGDVSNGLGVFTLNIPDSLLTDTLIISAIGHTSTIQPIEEIIQESVEEFYLSEQPYILPEVSIIPSHEITVGYVGKGEVNYCVREKFTQIARFMPMAKGREGILRKVGCFVTKYGRADTPFRVRIYGPGEHEASGPTYDLLLEHVIVRPWNKRKKWIEVNLESYQIPVDENGFFVAMEWIDVGTEFEFINTYRGKNKSEKVVNKGYGQTLGFTKKETINYTWHYLEENNPEKRWVQYSLPNNDILNAEIRAIVLIE